MSSLKKISAAVLSVLLVIISCSPVEYPTQLERTAVTDVPVIYCTPYAKKVDVKFAPVKNADSYTIYLGNEKQSVSMSFIGGMYSFTINKLNPSTGYEISIEASNDAQDASPVKGTASFTTLADNGELDYAPIAYMSDRTESNAEITIHTMPGIDYRITFDNDAPEIIQASNDETITREFSIEKSKTGKVLVEHKKTTDFSYSTYVTNLAIPAYTGNFDTSVGMEIDGFSVSMKKLPDSINADNIYLLLFDGETGIPEFTAPKQVDDQGNLPIFDLSSFGSLRSGLLVLAFVGNSGEIVYGNPIYHTTPAVPEYIADESDQQNATFRWIQPEDIGDVIYTISGDGITPSDVSLNGNEATLKLSSLDSNKAYSLTIEATLPNGETTTGTTEFTTPSFSGIYRWVCPTPGEKVTSFVVQVWDKDDADKNGFTRWNDDYKYHLFVDPSDPAYTDAMKGISIMPLFKNAEEIPTSPIPYKNNTEPYQIGYRWNESKWNATGTIHPSKWLPDHDDISGDTVVSYTWSWAIVGQLTTKTNFTFRVKDGKPQLVFRNAGEGSGASTVNMGLFKNPDPESGTDKFTFVLDRIGSVPVQGQ